eukprot:6194155-Pleurochrysis_carterae.AAC.1
MPAICRGLLRLFEFDATQLGFMLDPQARDGFSIELERQRAAYVGTVEQVWRDSVPTSFPVSAAGCLPLSAVFFGLCLSHSLFPFTALYTTRALYVSFSSAGRLLVASRLRAHSTHHLQIRDTVRARQDYFHWFSRI